jgi:hypothetical protein
MTSENSAHILDDEDEETLTILRNRVESSNQGRLVKPKEARKQISKWLTKSSVSKRAKAQKVSQNTRKP